ncbi:MAG: hypothetical protein KF764_35060 [Labilithrix sp.]|nr:hypothetical protein [Labilithrix sp.]MBX3222961.1 hypothetical protein [Labilithrix sp.]
MRRLAFAFPYVLLLAAGGAVVTACGAIKAADAVADPGPADGETGEEEEEPGTSKDGSVSDDLDGSTTKKDASKKDANDPVAEPCTEAVCPTDVIASGLHGPVAVAVNATHVFWIEVGSTIPGAGNYGQLIRLAKGTTCADRSCFDVVDPLVLDGELEGRYIYNTFIALGANDVCYTQTYNASPGHTISCFALTTLTKRNLVTGTGAAASLWVGATQARWAISANGATRGEIRGRPLTGGTAQALVPLRPDPTSVTSDGTALYWTEREAAGAPKGNVAALRSDGGVAILASDRAGPTSAKAHGGYLYWLEYSSKLVMRVRADGTGTPETIATTDANPFALVVDDSGVYWASAGAAQTGSEGSVARAPLTPNGQKTTMMSNVRSIYDLAVDSTSIYITSVGAQLGQGRVLRMSKVR